MKVESRLFGFLFFFFLIATAIYTVSGFVVEGKPEPIGVTVLLFPALLGGMIMAYLKVEGRRIPTRPEDTKSGEIAQGAGVLGFFPPKSIWPFWCALTCAVMLLGPVFGWWITILGAVMGVWAVCGWCYEYYVGDYSH